MKGVPAPFPKVLGNGLAGRAAIAANIALIRLSKTLFSYQIFIEAESTPGVDFLVRDAEVRSAVRDAAAVAGAPQNGAPAKIAVTSSSTR